LDLSKFETLISMCWTLPRLDTND